MSFIKILSTFLLINTEYYCIYCSFTACRPSDPLKIQSSNAHDTENCPLQPHHPILVHDYQETESFNVTFIDCAHFYFPPVQSTIGITVTFCLGFFRVHCT